MTNPQPWKLLKTKDISPSKWFPLEERTYELPDGSIVDDFSVTTLADVAMVIPITPDGKVIFAKQFKPGANQITLEFPAGRQEPHHKDILETAHTELLEETGIVAENLIEIGEAVIFPTKASEIVTYFVMKDAQVTQKQKLDESENIVLEYVPIEKVDEMIILGKINTAPTITAWFLLKLKHPELLSGK